MTRSAYEFDSPDADLVLVTCEATRRFHVHRSILSIASPFFHDMFSLPQKQPHTPNDDTPEVQMTETEQVLEALLRFIYPVEDPHISSLTELSRILEAAVKYEMSCVISALRRILISREFLDREPTSVFAIASRYGLDAEAKEASKHTLKCQILDGPFLDEFRDISAYSYHCLLDLHRKRVRQGEDLIVGALPPIGERWTDYERRVKEELQKAPHGRGIFELEFFANSYPWDSVCSTCRSRVRKTLDRLADVKKRIEELPETIEI